MLLCKIACLFYKMVVLCFLTCISSGVTRGGRGGRIEVWGEILEGRGKEEKGKGEEQREGKGKESQEQKGQGKRGKRETRKKEKLRKKKGNCKREENFKNWKGTGMKLSKGTPPTIDCTPGYAPVHQQLLRKNPYVLFKNGMNDLS